MPSLELHGYDEHSGAELVRQIRVRLADVGYREEIVFDVTRGGGRVEGWDGSDQRFLRICSRTQDRLDDLRGRLNGLCDVETLLIGFFPRVT